MGRILVIVWLLISGQLQAAAPAVGTHGMALMKVADKLIASHMPLHHSMHARQVIIEVDVASSLKPQLLTLLAEHSLVSIQPEVFDLAKLENGEVKQFTAKVFAGHFERAGQVRLDNITVNVKSVLLSEPTELVANGQFYLIDLDGEQGLLVHRIGRLPSFDQILWIKYVVVPDKRTIELNTNDAFLSCKQFNLQVGRNMTCEKLLYLETQDFLP